MNVINMDAINVMVKDVANFFNNLDDLDYRGIAAFYNEDGYLDIDTELRDVWRNKVKFYNKRTVQGVDILVFIVLKGDEEQ